MQPFDLCDSALAVENRSSEANESDGEAPMRVEPGMALDSHWPSQPNKKRFEKCDMESLQKTDSHKMATVLYRYVVLFVTLFATTTLLSNGILFTFTIICMNPEDKFENESCTLKGASTPNRKPKSI
uniref:G_PROTEIN_RECEP_F1_2 domain-containing protein n=1 Tax=Steinernema glaseri TaxID=37863 RepID=A0A1I7YSR4_9BILA